MKVRFTRRALQDLVDIADYLNGVNRSGAAKVARAIASATDVLAKYPLSGRRQSVPTVRKAVTKRYGYLIYYAVNETDQAVDILTVQHRARGRPFSDL